MFGFLPPEGLLLPTDLDPVLCMYPTSQDYQKQIDNLPSRPRCYASEAKPSVQVRKWLLQWYSQVTDRTNNLIALASMDNVGLAYHALSSGPGYLDQSL